MHRALSLLSEEEEERVVDMQGRGGRITRASISINTAERDAGCSCTAQEEEEREDGGGSFLALYANRHDPRGRTSHDHEGGRLGQIQPPYS